MSGISSTQHQLIRRGNEILRLSDGKRAAPSDFKNAQVALFIHGFTADASCMAPLMQQFSDSGYVALAFNYACFDGIDIAAQSLNEILEGLDCLSGGAIVRHRMVIIGHSMGGLVARALLGLHRGHRFLRKVITLGTPHDGTLTEQRYIEYLLAWSESLSGIVQGGFSPKCRSALQLIGRDAPDFLLEKLKQMSVPEEVVEFHSVSGGLAFLEFGRGGYVSRLANAWIQLNLYGLANDGLVAEASSNLSQPMFAVCAPKCSHDASYASYPKVNHTNLVHDYVVALRAIQFADRAAPQAASLGAMPHS
jgi:pimeloyl-ACP methyl ester carboxylesterase